MEDEKPSPFVDLIAGGAWLALAIAIMVAAWTMDRLQHLKIPIFTVPGLVPGLLGAAIGLASIVLIVRSLRAGALAGAHWPSINFREHWRLIAVLILCLGYAIGLIGHGLPFWLGSAIFVAAFIFTFQFADRRREGTLPRGALVAVTVGLVSALVIHYAFQDLFLVRLP
jgi:hypothetical protein